MWGTEYVFQAYDSCKVDRHNVFVFLIPALPEFADTTVEQEFAVARRL
jgi:hypothetical protein